MLIGAGIGIIAGIFAVVLLIFWWVHKRRHTASTSVLVQSNQTAGGGPDEGLRSGAMDYGGMPPRAEEPYSYAPSGNEKQYYSQPKENYATGDPSVSRINNHVDYGDPARPPEHGGVVGSPEVITLPSRALYPSNPSPDPRHLQAKDENRSSVTSRLTQSNHAPTTAPPLPPSAMRNQTPSSAMRQSIHSSRLRGSVHFAGASPLTFSEAPPPAPDPTTDHTRPLSVRKTTASSIAIPSYYESTGQSGYAQSMYKSVFSSSSSESVPPYVSPQGGAGEPRRPSGASEGSGGAGSRRPTVARKGSEDKGGMI